MVKYNEKTLSDLPTNMPVARVEFDYDYMSRRVGKTVYNWGSNGWQEVSSATFLYDAWNLISEQTHRSVLLLSCLLLGICCSCSVDMSAGDSRPYADLCMSRGDLVFLLLSQRDVQTDLSLEADQISTVEVIRSQDFREIPNVTNTLALAGNAEGQQEHTDLILKAGEQIDKYRINALSGALNRSQSERLWQIVRQVEGTASWNLDSEVWMRLGLSAEQRTSVNAVCETYTKKRKDIVHRLARQMIAGLSHGETLADREKEVRQLSREVRTLESVLDKHLLEILSGDQKAKWDSVIGKPLHIEWDKGGPPLLMYY
jgi:hypothetical protein